MFGMFEPKPQVPVHQRDQSPHVFDQVGIRVGRPYVKAYLVQTGSGPPESDSGVDPCKLAATDKGVR